MLVEVHMIQNHSPANLNRDNLGAPKTAIFGGYPRARISSQCLKRSIRTSSHFRDPLDGFIGIRTVHFPARVNDALEKSRFSKADCKKIVEACTKIAKAEKKEPSEGKASVEELRTAQLIHCGPDEAELFVAALQELKPDDLKGFLKEPCPQKPTDYTKKLSQAYHKNAVDIGLFGRMTTSPAFNNVEASMQVAHALSTHEVALDVDYFTAVDDDPRGRAGAALVKEFQFVSATFYKYFSLHWDGLVANLDGDADLAQRTLAAFLHAAAKTVPSGKRNSFANNNLPDFVLVEVRESNVPTNYANAFVAPARERTDRDGDHDVVSESIRMLAQYSNELVDGFGIASTRAWWVCRRQDQDVELVTENASAKRYAKYGDLVDATVQLATGTGV